LVIPLGPVDIGTYALATVGTITVTDLSSGVTFAYDVPQGFGVDVVPEPGALLPVSVMLLGFGCYGFYRWRQSRGPSTTV
jgi:hypothetical protein